MQFWDILYAVANKQGLPVTKIGEKAGLNRAYVSVGKNKGTVPTLETAEKLLSTCNYALCAVPVDGIPESAYRITTCTENGTASEG